MSYAAPSPASYAAPARALGAMPRPAVRPVTAGRPIARGYAGAGSLGGGTAAGYRDAELAVATPGQLVVMLFDKCLLTVRRAEAAFSDPAARTEHVCRATEMLGELRGSLDFEAGDGGALSCQLDALYGWASAELFRAHRELAPARLAPVQRVLAELRDAFAGAQAQLAAAGPTARSA